VRQPKKLHCDKRFHNFCGIIRNRLQKITFTQAPCSSIFRHAALQCQLTSDCSSSDISLVHFLLYLLDSQIAQLHTSHLRASDVCRCSIKHFEPLPSWKLSTSFYYATMSSKLSSLLCMASCYIQQQCPTYLHNLSHMGFGFSSLIHAQNQTNYIQ
jgi:hypothetical protein